MFWLLPAYAASTFVADEPGLAELATVAWAQAVACTGREAQAYPTVVIDVGRVTGGFAGKASTVSPGGGPRGDLVLHVDGAAIWTPARLMGPR